MTGIIICDNDTFLEVMDHSRNSIMNIMAKTRRMKKMSNIWDTVPAGTPACIVIWDTPCCNCGDCNLTEKTIRISENVELRIEVYDDGNQINGGFSFYNRKKRRTFTELELHDNELGISYSELKKIINQLFTVFKPMQVVDHTLDEYTVEGGGDSE